MVLAANRTSADGAYRISVNPWLGKGKKVPENGQKMRLQYVTLSRASALKL
jgi:hypothetical protein